MENEEKLTFLKKLKNIFIGRSRNPQDRNIFHNIALIAFFAWIGLGADGLSSSCYGPSEAFLALQRHTYLSIFVAVGTVITIFVICTSYKQIIELFPHGGGGYIVASKLLSPTVGMVSGCALLIDYVLTISVSIAAGADAVFSLLPFQLAAYKFEFTILIIVLLIILNMRGIKESVLILTPIFLIFIATHLFIILYAVITHIPMFSSFVGSVKNDTVSSIGELGVFGVIFIILKAYSMGAGTFTGIEAVSNGMPVLRDPKIETGKKTMNYMAYSLAFVVLGLMISYLLYSVVYEPGKTLNAVLFEKATSSWKFGYYFVFITLLAEALLLFVAAQTGFLDGPRVLSNMATDRWFPTRFSTLSDRLVTQNGVLIMGGLAILLMFITRGSVQFLVVLYSINVFITFVLSQLGMVRHWWLNRGKVKKWVKKLCVNGFGLCLCSFILISMIVMKFKEGGWITIFVTGALVLLAIITKRHYIYTTKLLHRLNDLVSVAQSVEPLTPEQLEAVKTPDRKAKTAVLLVSGFNGMGLHTLFGVIRLFGNYKNFVFIEVGVFDAGNFKGIDEVGRLEIGSRSDLDRYVRFMQSQGFYAEGVLRMGVDVVDEVEKAAPDIMERFPNAVFFGGQLIFPKDSFMLRVLHNYTVFTVQKKLYRQGVPFVILPIRV